MPADGQKGSLVFGGPCASRWMTPGPPRCLFPKTGGLSLWDHGPLGRGVGVDDLVGPCFCPPLGVLQGQHSPRLYRPPPHERASPGAFVSLPSRRWAVLCCPSRPLSAHAGPIGSFDTFSPRQYRHTPQTVSG